MAHDVAHLLSDFVFKEATPDERAESLALFHHVYTNDIGHVPADGLDAVASHLIAKTRSGEIVACCRLLGPQQRPFEIERYCDLSRHLSRSATAGLLGRFSVRHDMRSAHRAIPLQLGMFKLALHFARGHGISDLVLYAMPHLVTFYRSVFFKPLDCSFVYEPLKATMQIMHLNLIALEERRAQLHSPRLEFLLSTHLTNFEL